MKKLRILVAGADGFLGRHVTLALRTAGHGVVIGGRRPARDSVGDDFVRCDFSRDLDPADWDVRLANIDAVVNCIGILRETSTNTFARIHIEGPLALFKACERVGIRRVIHISALGPSGIGEYLASKHRGDTALARLDLDWTILRPSLVYATRGSYGGTSLLRALAALPGIIIVPGDGGQRIQPVLADDLGRLVVRLIEDGSGVRELIEVAGPETVTFREFLALLRGWLELPPARILQTPVSLAHGVAWFGERFGDGPLGLTMWRMLQAGNVASPASSNRLATIGCRPVPVREAFGAEPSFVQDRWHARLYFLGPMLRIAIAVLWIISGIAGFVTPAAEADRLLGGVGLAPGAIMPLVWFASTVDILLGMLALLAWRIELVASLMVLSLIVYTIAIGVIHPAAWLEPLGGLAKNLVLIPGVIIMAVLAKRR